MIESNQNRLVGSSTGDDTQEVFENKLRPRTMADYIGQDVVKENLRVAIEATKKRNEALDHVLFHGPPGLGKTTLANVIARELGVNIRVSSGPALEKQGDIASILSNMEDHDVWFIDEIHRLKPNVEEVLYSAMEDFQIDIVIGSGPSARTMSLNLPRFTLIGATTKLSMISSPLRDRFGNRLQLEFYNEEQMKQIILRSADVLDCKIDDIAATLLAKSSRQTPRIANRLLKRVRDFAEVYGKDIVDLELVQDALSKLGVDSLGLDQRDREILDVIIKKFEGGPVGLSTLAAAISEEKSTLEDVYEPFLIQLGFLKRTHRGRVVTPGAYKHIDIAL